MSGEGGGEGEGEGGEGEGEGECTCAVTLALTRYRQSRSPGGHWGASTLMVERTCRVESTCTTHHHAQLSVAFNTPCTLEAGHGVSL